MKLGPGLTFSRRRELGVTAEKHCIARATEIPTTRTGSAKLGRILGIE